jgi:hypothetical protein
MASVAPDYAELARQLEDMREQQRAISGVLRAVARSAGIQPVLDEVVDAYFLYGRQHSELQRLSA